MTEDTGLVEVSAGPSGGSTTGGDTDDGEQVGTTSFEPPRLVGPDGRTVVPVYVETIEWQRNNDTTTHTLRCGTTLTDPTTVDQRSATVEGLLTASQVEAVEAMNPESATITVDSVTTTAAVSFDTFTYTEQDDLNEGTFTIGGETITEPVVTFQLQTEEDEDDGGLLS